MATYLLRRLMIAVVLMIGAASLVFVLLHSIPGDPARLFLGDFATEDQVAAVHHAMGLDRPLPVQYASWLWNASHLDLGTSLSQNRPVRSLILQRLPRTLEIVVCAIGLAVLIGIPLGILAALRRGRPSDTSITAGSLLGLSVPSYVTGTLLVLLFAVRLSWLPASGYVNFSDNPRRHVLLLILPCVTLASQLSASIMRLTRSSVLEVINQDHVRTARSKGLSERQVIVRHVLRNSLIPVTTIIGIQAGNLLGGAVIVETIFSWPGLSTLLFRGIETRDFPVVQACVLTTSGLFILFTLIVDVVHGIIDPRAGHGTS